MSSAEEVARCKENLTTRSIETELTALRKKALSAEERLCKGEAGPISLGRHSLEVYLMFDNSLSQNLHLSWEKTDVADDTDIGEVMFYGDPSLLHQALAMDIAQSIMQDARAQGLLCVVRGGVTIQLKIAAGNVRSPELYRTRIKDPDATFGRHSQDISLCTAVLEVAWRNESLTEFVREIEDWSLAGFNAVGIKVWPLQKHLSADASSGDKMSVLVIARAAHQNTTQVWRHGSKALQAPIRRGIVQEKDSESIVLPAMWFVYKSDRSAPNVGDGKMIALSMHSLACQLGSIAQEAKPQEGQDSKNLRAAMHQVILRDLEIASIRQNNSLTEECRAKLLARRENERVLEQSEVDRLRTLV
ncbi:unnamed protein product [Jaminaea pallidilutea]